MPKSKPDLLSIYDLLRSARGPLGWWPAETEFEVVVGAVLTQNTSWSNVEKAIANLRRSRALSPHALHTMDVDSLEQLIRPAGYFRVKARRLKAVVDHLFTHYAGSIDAMARRQRASLRDELLGVHGIGPETADSILLYALDQPSFVIDAYTRRIFSRIGWTSPDASYDELQRFFVERLPSETALYNDFHAQIVMIGKEYCRPKSPRCDACPLESRCAYAQARE